MEQEKREQRSRSSDRPFWSHLSLFSSAVRSIVWWLKPKRHPERDLSALTQSLRTLLGDQPVSVLVFGSLASGDFDPKHSDVNVLVVAHFPLDVLRQMRPALKPWLANGHAAPVLVTPEDLPVFARDFPIEFLDMQDHHRVLLGDNLLAGLTVDKRHLHAQCEHDLALAQLKLRQAIAAAGENVADLRLAMARSLPSVLTLMRAAYWLGENAAKLDKINAAEQMAERVGHEAVVLQKLNEHHYRRRTDNVKDIAVHYLDLIDAVLKHVRK